MRLRPTDLVRVGTLGLRARRLRTALTSLGIAIGIAAMVAVVGISASSRADLVAQLDALGTDLLRVSAGNDIFGDAAALPERSTEMAARIGPVRAAAATTDTAKLADRTEHLRRGLAAGLPVLTTDLGTLDAVSGTVNTGRWHDPASASVPTAVLGNGAARRMGIDSVVDGVGIHIGGTWFRVIGILDPLPLAPELDGAVLIGRPVATTLWDTTISPTTIYVRSDPEQVEAVRSVLARQTNPAAPNEVTVSRPSDALEARAATDEALRNLLLGLGAVALVVGGVGITNVMVISVLERRSEIGLRRALGARRRHIVGQFLTESAVLASLGGLAGLTLGVAVTAGYARSQRWTLDVPPEALAAGLATAVAVGLIAGVSPAIRAARLDPADAVRPR